MIGRRNLCWLVAGALTWMPALTWAAEEASPPTLSWHNLIGSGGWPVYLVMGVLAAMSLLTLAFLFYFLVMMRISQIAPRPLHRELVEKIRDGQLDDARRACEYRPTPLAAVTRIAIDHLRGVKTLDANLLKEVIQGEGSRQADALEGQTRYLLDIAVIAPMVGLLGTVFGMLRAFSAVALDIAQARPMVLAGGVSQALVTTAFGLIVGIPAMILYAYFRRRGATLVAYLEAASTDVLTALLSSRDA